MLRRYFATYEYTEVVKGEPREFVHETILEAADLAAAKVLASRYFEETSWRTGVGWKRVLNRWRIAELPPAVPLVPETRVPSEGMAEK